MRQSDPPSSHRASIPEYEPGHLIGQKYRLVRRLGEGGMASVWVAHNEALDIHVAIKFIRGELAHPNLADRLMHEARAAARLGHPAIVRVTDFGKTKPGDPYIVMELLNGEDLGTALERRGRIAAIKAVRMLLPIAHALAAAHDKGIVHRDLKPENIFISQGDDSAIQPKLVDFGVAKLERPDFKRLTDVGTAVGSPGYMSPEQARGLDVDHRTDVWSFAVVLYEVVTGRLPFEGKSYNALLRSIIEDQPAPITNYAAGDPELWQIIERGLAKNFDERWQTMRDFGMALARWLMERGVSEDMAGASLYAAWYPTSDSSGAMASAMPLTSGGERLSFPGDRMSRPPMPSRPSRTGSDHNPIATISPETRGITSDGLLYPTVPPTLALPAASRARLVAILLGVAVVAIAILSAMLVFSRKKAAPPAETVGPVAAPIATPVGLPTPSAAAEPRAEPALEPEPSATGTSDQERAKKHEHRREHERSGSRNAPAAKPKATSPDLDIKTTF